MSTATQERVAPRLKARYDESLRARLQDEIGLANPHTVDAWIAEVNRLLAHHPGNQAVYIQVTRGVPPKRDHVIPKGLVPTVFMMASPLPTPSPEMVEKGVVFVDALPKNPSGKLLKRELRQAHAGLFGAA